jgi:hypothetical protein
MRTSSKIMLSVGAATALLLATTTDSVAGGNYAFSFGFGSGSSYFGGYYGSGGGCGPVYGFSYSYLPPVTYYYYSPPRYVCVPPPVVLYRPVYCAPPPPPVYCYPGSGNYLKR